jgi:2-polyprenyl-3-methyl-5-hydroxy-6-metoxy-1,4-benzoquinol methylase
VSDPEDTVGYYDSNAARFATETAALDMSPLHEPFLRRLPPSGRVLDAGCGVGRDALIFAERGFSVVAFDASLEMVRLARERVAARADVKHMRFEDVTWQDEFDGIWACASLLHVPAADFPAVAVRLMTALRPSGTCYMSFKHGTGERIMGGRCFIDYTAETLRTALRGTGLELAEAWVTDDVRADCQEEQWLNAMVVRGS